LNRRGGLHGIELHPERDMEFAVDTGSRQKNAA